MRRFFIPLFLNLSCLLVVILLTIRCSSKILCEASFLTPTDAIAIPACKVSSPPPQRSRCTSTSLQEHGIPVLQSTFLKSKDPPYLALITETDACDSDQRVHETFEAIKNALGDTNQNGIDLISLRVIKPQTNHDASHQNRLIDLTRRLMALKEDIRHKSASLGLNNNHFFVVINDNVEAAMEANADGVHVKETKVGDITQIRNLLLKKQQQEDNDEEHGGFKYRKKILIGTSAHCLDSALSTWREFEPDYFFIGTCFMTKSHPEKSVNELEGPALPGQVKKAIYNEIRKKNVGQVPAIFAIGGINLENCAVPVIDFGADGVAVIRAVMQASHPRDVVVSMKHEMKCKSDTR